MLSIFRKNNTIYNFGFLFCGLMLSSIHCNGICVDNTKFCAIIKDFAPLTVQPALEDCPTSLIICDGEQIVLFWKAEAALTSTIHLTGPGGESYEYSIIEGQATVTPGLRVFGGSNLLEKIVLLKIHMGSSH